MARSYARVRTQFGRPIGSFQAIKHICAEMFLGAGPSNHVAQLSLNEISKIGCIGNIDPALRRSDL